MNVQERIAKLEALLARVSTRAAEPRHTTVGSSADGVVAADAHPPAMATNGPAVAPPLPEAPPTPVPVVAAAAHAPPAAHASPVDVRAPVPREEPEEEAEELELDAVELTSVRPPPVRPEPSAVTEDPTESRERMVAAPALDELTDVARLPPVQERASRDSDGPTMARTAPSEDDAPELEVSETAELEPEGAAEEEPPSSSRRPISMEPSEPPLEELAFGDAPAPPMPHTPPPESGRQVAVTPPDLDFDSEATGVRNKPDEAMPASAPAPAHAAAHAPAAAFRAKSVPPAAVAAPPAPVAPVKLTPHVLRPSLEAPDGVAVFVGQPAEFKPSSFGDLLDASIDL